MRVNNQWDNWWGNWNLEYIQHWKYANQLDIFQENVLIILGMCAD